MVAYSVSCFKTAEVTKHVRGHFEKPIFVGWNLLLGTLNARHGQCQHRRTAVQTAFGIEMVYNSVTGISHHPFLTQP